MSGEDHFQRGLAALLHFRAVGDDLHTLGHRIHAGGDKARRAAALADLNHTNTASADLVDLFQEAQSGDLHAGITGGFQNGCAPRHADRDAVDAFLSCFSVDELDKFEDAYQGEFDSEEDFAYHIIDECYDIEQTMGNLSFYFDYEKFARDLFMCDYFFDNGYVFRR